MPPKRPKPNAELINLLRAYPCLYADVKWRILPKSRLSPFRRLFMPLPQAISLTAPYYVYFGTPLALFLLMLSVSNSDALLFIINLPTYTAVPLLILLGYASLTHPHETVTAPVSTRAAFTLNVALGFLLAVVVTLAPSSPTNPLWPLFALASLTLFTFYLIAYTHLAVSLTSLTLTVVLSPRYT